MPDSESYTLSLHDALPIWSTVSSLGVLFGYLILFEGIVAGFRQSIEGSLLVRAATVVIGQEPILMEPRNFTDRKSTRLNSSHMSISYAVFCLKKKTLYVCK